MDQELGAGQVALNSHKEWTRNWVQVNNGTKEYIQILLLLNKYSVQRIAKAISKALNYRVYCYDGVLQFILTRQEYAFTSFSLAGREHLRCITVNTTKVSAYSSLVSGGRYVKQA